MKKYIILISICIIIIFNILLTKNIIIFNKGTIDGFKYSTVKKEHIQNEDISLHPWNKLEICEQYNYTSLNSLSPYYYNCNSEPIPQILIDKKIEDVIVEGYDYGTGMECQKNAIAYSILNISLDYVIAIKFENSNKYYTYISGYCKPTNVKELWKNYNLNNYININDLKYKKTVLNKSISLIYNNININEIQSFFGNYQNNLYDFSESIDSQYIEITTTSPVYGTSFTFYITNDNKLIISIPSIKKKLCCNIEQKNTLFKYIKENYISEAIIKY